MKPNFLQRFLQAKTETQHGATIIWNDYQNHYEVWSGDKRAGSELLKVISGDFLTTKLILEHYGEKAANVFLGGLWDQDDNGYWREL